MTAAPTHPRHRLAPPALRGLALLLGALLAPVQPARGQWIDERNVDSFHIRAEFPLNDDEGRQLIQEIGELESDVLTLLALQPGTGPAQLNLFKSQSTYRQHILQRVPEGASRPALFVQGSDMGRVYVAKRRGYFTDVRHECTHAVLHGALPYVPLWLDEGFAEYFEVPADSRASGSPYLKSLKRSILFGWKPNLDRLESLQQFSDMGDREYRESWAWVHFMLHGPPEVRQALSDYLAAIADGGEVGRLAVQLRAVDPQIERRMVGHFRHWR